MSSDNQQQQQQESSPKPLHLFDRNVSDPVSTIPLLRHDSSPGPGRFTKMFPSSSMQSRPSFSAETTAPTSGASGTTIPSITCTLDSDKSGRNQQSPSFSYVNRTPTSSRAPSRAASPIMSDMSDELPSNVSNEDQLDELPAECLSGDKDRPLQHFGEDGDISTYALRPMMYSVVYILTVELLERFAFYGLNYTQTSYLTGAYDDHWNAGMESVPASSYVSISVAVAYTTPFLGAIFADSLFGDYYTIVVGALVFYLPGLFLIASTTIPGLLGHDFNRSALAFGLLILWPVGTGVVKSVVNVFGAKQFHPLLQSSSIEAYYVNFYMCINVGALIGGVAVPVIAQHNVTVAYFLPVVMLSIGIMMFIAGSSRYVRNTPKGNIFSKKSMKVPPPPPSQNDTSSLMAIARVSLLVVPFNIAYSQMATTFIIQGNVMKRAFGWIDAATMNNADAVAVLAFGYIIGSGFYPWLAARGIKIPTTYKFAIGSALGALSIAWALMVDKLIHSTYAETQSQITIMWQTMSYILIGVGEIFAVSAAYEVAFTAAPPEMKVLSSAVNLFCIGGLPNVICIGLYQACRPWFTNSNGTTHITHIHDYATSHVAKYFWLLFGIAMFGVLVNLLPPVREFVESIEEKASDMIRTPKTPMRPPKRELVPDEEQELLKVKRHQYYLKYGSGPSLYKSGSMRAGPSLKSKSGRDLNASSKRLRKNVLARLYKSEVIKPQAPKIMLSASGKPVMARDMPNRSRPLSRQLSG